MFGLLVIFFIVIVSVSVGVCVGVRVTVSDKLCRQWVVGVMSFRNMYGCMGLWKIGSEKLDRVQTKTYNHNNNNNNKDKNNKEIALLDQTYRSPIKKDCSVLYSVQLHVTSIYT